MVYKIVSGISPVFDVVSIIYSGLTKDIEEENDIAQQHPEEVKKLEAIRKEWDSQLIEPIFKGLIMSKGKKTKEEDKE